MGAGGRGVGALTCWERGRGIECAERLWSEAMAACDGEEASRQGADLTESGVFKICRPRA